MDNESLTTYICVTTKIAEYRDRHRGRYPARIFVSTAAFIELVENAHTTVCNAMSHEVGGDKLFGVPVVYFGGDDPLEVYLSDEEEPDGY